MAAIVVYDADDLSQVDRVFVRFPKGAQNGGLLEFVNCEPGKDCIR